MTQFEPNEYRPQRSRLIGIDALRGLAALFVVYYHYVWRYDEKFRPASKSLLWFDVSVFGEDYFAKMAVFLFFMISGFVISLTLASATNTASFVVSRFSRLYPAYFVCMTLTFLSSFIFPLPSENLDVKDYVVNLTMVQEYLGAESIDGVYWSLHVEICFYAMMAALLAFGKARCVLLFSLCWVLFGIVANFARSHLGLHLPLKLDVLLALQYAHFFAAGVAFHSIWRGEEGRLPYLVLAITAVSLFASLPAIVAATSLLFYLLFAGVILGRLEFLNNRYLVGAGAISYAVYLLHQKIGYRIIMFLSEHGVSRDIGIAVALVSVIFLAYAVTKWIEKPAIRLIRNWFRSRQLRTETI
jgi:peptidoglycan/LPS O-acetylase OafA/YrhL